MPEVWKVAFATDTHMLDTERLNMKNGYASKDTFMARKSASEF